jgi:hypothetical protein
MNELVDNKELNLVKRIRCPNLNVAYSEACRFEHHLYLVGGKPEAFQITLNKRMGSTEWTMEVRRDCKNGEVSL